MDRKPCGVRHHCEIQENSSALKEHIRLTTDDLQPTKCQDEGLEMPEDLLNLR